MGEDAFMTRPMTRGSDKQLALHRKVRHARQETGAEAVACWGCDSTEVEVSMVLRAR
jgi:hypothetical protein